MHKEGWKDVVGAILLMVGGIVLVFGVLLALIAGAIVGWYLAYTDVMAGEMFKALLWAILGVFCTLGLLARFR